MIHVVLVSPQIHWNTGNAGRTCLAAGATLHLVKPLGFSLDAKEVRRAGLDYWESVPLRVWDSFDELERTLPALGEAFFVSPGADRTIWDVAFPDRVALLFGSETSGFPLSICESRRDRMVSVPMKDDSIRSLNLSTTVGISVYEVLRQRSPSARNLSRR